MVDGRPAPLGARSTACIGTAGTRARRKSSARWCASWPATAVTTLDRVGLGRKLPAQLRRRSHIKRARAAAKAKGEKQEKI
jgi:hypothetical protein